MRLTRVTHDHRDDQVFQMSASDDIHVYALLKFEGRVLPKNSGHWKCASHVLHTTKGTSELEQCVFNIIGIVGRCGNSTAESDRRVLSGGNEAYTL